MTISGIKLGEFVPNKNQNPRGRDDERNTRLRQIHSIDDSLNARAGFRIEIGTSQSEYAAQVKLAKRLGFAATLAAEMSRQK